MGIPLASPPALVRMRFPVVVTSMMIMIMMMVMFGMYRVMVSVVRSCTILDRADSVALVVVVVVVSIIDVRRVLPVVAVVVNMALSVVSAMMLHPSPAFRTATPTRLASRAILPLTITIVMVAGTTKIIMVMMVTRMVTLPRTAAETIVHPAISPRFLPPVARTARVVYIPRPRWRPSTLPDPLSRDRGRVSPHPVFRFGLGLDTPFCIAQESVV